MEITIDKNSGYCFGVEYAIQMAENELDQNGHLYCLGDIVHNSMEVKRLTDRGLQVIDKADLANLHDCKVLIRAHGEPPETYQLALQNNIELIDASCPVVLKLQNRVKNEFDTIERKGGQMIIYGQHGHAEVIGLNGQIGNKATIVTKVEDLEGLDYSKPISLFSQTTKSTAGFQKIKERIEEKLSEIQTDSEIEAYLDANDSICRQVSNREPHLLNFAPKYDLILFVSGRKSSNGKALFAVCESVNPNSHFIENETEILPEWLHGIQSIGICGATSTPHWLMKQVADKLEEINKAFNDHV